MDPHLAASVARSLAMEQAAGEAIGALEKWGREVVIIKGPATRSVLGEDFRPSADLDVMVAEHELSIIVDLLLEVGYRRGKHPNDELGFEVMLRHPSAGFALDVHYGLQTATVPPPEQWAALAAHRVRRTLAGQSVWMASPSATRCHLIASFVQDGMPTMGRRREEALRVASGGWDWERDGDYAHRAGLGDAIRVGLRELGAAETGGDHVATAVHPRVLAHAFPIPHSGGFAAWLELPMHRRVAAGLRKMWPTAAYLAGYHPRGASWPILLQRLTWPMLAPGRLLRLVMARNDAKRGRVGSEQGSSNRNGRALS